MSSCITHIYSVIAADTGEIRRHVLGPADCTLLVAADETVCVQTLTTYCGAPVEVVGRPREELVGRLLHILSQLPPVEPGHKLMLRRGDILATQFWPRGRY